MMEFNLSTMWNARSHDNGRDIIEQTLRMGFDGIELNYLITEKLLKDMEPMIYSHEVKISSVHNVFPKVYSSDYDTDSPLLGYLDKEKRKNSIELTKVSIDHAARLGAEVVVIHPSTVETEKDYDLLLKKMYNNGLKYSNEYNSLFKEFQSEIDKKTPLVLNYIAESCEILSDYIAKKGYSVKLGLENRAKCYQQPTFKEAKILLDKLVDMPVYFWYDIGHGIMMENLGLFSVDEDIEKIKDKIIGVHIHDASGVEDHFYPYKFGEGFDKYLDIIKNAPIKVFEIGPKCTETEVTNSLLKLKSKF